MSSPLHYVNVPHENANDDFGIVANWLVEDGDVVSVGDAVIEMEFSKSIIELESPSGGHLFHMVQVGDEVAVGDAVAVIGDSAKRPDAIVQGGREDAVAPRVTEKARTLLEAREVSLTEFAGLDVVRVKDVETYLESHGSNVSAQMEAGERVPVSAFQKRLARNLTISSQTIPASSLTHFVDTAAVEIAVDDIGEKHDMAYTVSDHLVYSVASASRIHPRANSSWRDDHVLVWNDVNVGFAVALEDGELVVPVLTRADTLSPQTLSQRIRTLHAKALMKKLRTEDVEGGTITVTSLIGTGVHEVQPIVFPGQAAIVAIGDSITGMEPAMYGLTVVYDHRLMNGNSAAQFLASVADQLVSHDFST